MTFERRGFGFGKNGVVNDPLGLFNSAQKTRKNKLDERRTMKTPNPPSIYEQMKAIDNLPLPPDLKEEIRKLSRKRLNEKQRGSITRGSRNVVNKAQSKKQLHKIHEQYDYSPSQIKTSMKIFNDLDGLRYQRRYVLALAEIGRPNLVTLTFIDAHWKDIVAYISNRKEFTSNTGRYYMNFVYGDEIPSKVNFKQIVLDMDNYLNETTQMTQDYDDPGDL